MKFTVCPRNTSRKCGNATIASLFILLFFMMIAVVMPSNVSAEAAAQKDGWEFGGNLYMWMANIGGKTATGDDYKVTFDDLLKDLDLVYMGGLEARNGRWHITTDIIYMNLEQDNDGKLTLPHGGSLKADATVKLQSWVVTPAAGYAFIQTEKVNTEVFAGIRYLWMEPELDLDISGPSYERDRNISDSADFWDGIAGIRGDVNLDKNWYVPYYVDIGTGDSTLTWQWLAGVGVRISRVVDVVAAWRYLYWKFDDNKVLDKMYINGPGVGIKVRF